MHILRQYKYAIFKFGTWVLFLAFTVHAIFPPARHPDRWAGIHRVTGVLVILFALLAVFSRPDSDEDARKELADLRAEVARLNAWHRTQTLINLQAETLPLSQDMICALAAIAKVCNAQPGSGPKWLELTIGDRTVGRKVYPGDDVERTIWSVLDTSPKTSHAGNGSGHVAAG